MLFAQHTRNNAPQELSLYPPRLWQAARPAAPWHCPVQTQNMFLGHRLRVMVMVRIGADVRVRVRVRVRIMVRFGA